MGGRISDCRGFGSFFEGRMGCLTALLESMEWQMPSQLKVARIAIERLFVVPFGSSVSCFEKWEERDWRSGLVLKIRLDAWKVNKGTIAEAKELVREGNSPYWIKREGKKDELVLCFVGALIRVSVGVENN